MPLTTLRIKPNDSVTLKNSLENYARQNSEGVVPRRPNYWNYNVDPTYILNMVDARLFGGATVTVEFVEVVKNFDAKKNVVREFTYIYVVDNRRNEARFPINFINKKCSLYRDHHRIKLHNKILTN